MRKMGMLLVASMLATCSIPAWAQFSFKKVEVRTSFGAAEQGNKGKLLINSKRIRFTKKNESTEYFSIPAKAVTEVFYSRVSGRRIGAAILVTPLLLFTKGRKHYMTLSFNDGAELAGAVEFKLHKSNYRGILRTVEQVTGKSMLYDQEGVKDTKQTVASRGGGGANQSILKITSDPEGAEVEIDGSFTGDSPRSNPVAPGKYKLRLRKKGYRDWERKGYACGRADVGSARGDGEQIARPGQGMTGEGRTLRQLAVLTARIHGSPWAKYTTVF